MRSKRCSFSSHRLWKIFHKRDKTSSSRTRVALSVPWVFLIFASSHFAVTMVPPFPPFSTLPMFFGTWRWRRAWLHENTRELFETHRVCEISIDFNESASAAENSTHKLRATIYVAEFSRNAFSSSRRKSVSRNSDFCRAVTSCLEDFIDAAVSDILLEITLPRKVFTVYDEFHCRGAPNEDRQF